MGLLQSVHSSYDLPHALAGAKKKQEKIRYPDSQDQTCLKELDNPN